MYKSRRRLAKALSYHIFHITGQGHHIMDFEKLSLLIHQGED